jgi:shikimate kinase
VRGNCGYRHYFGVFTPYPSLLHPGPERKAHLEHQAMAKSDNIFLIGLMGVGKTTIGRKLAEKLGKTFLDCDREIEERTGVTIELIFEIEGEEGFRRRESAVLDELTARSNVVIATGGGAVLGPENREWLKERGTVVYLNAPVKILAGRTQADRKRPLLQTEDRLARLTELLREREPFYLEIADVIINTDDLPMRKVVDSICGSLESQ